jgi:hypothetical protein
MEWNVRVFYYVEIVKVTDVSVELAVAFFRVGRLYHFDMLLYPEDSKREYETL